ncbi:MAG: hypothetical protein NVSMB38_45210 [Ktedonobacteraceae bacterium]
MDIPLSTNGQWTDLLNRNKVVTTQDYRLHNYPVSSNWGCLFGRSKPLEAFDPDDKIEL